MRLGNANAVPSILAVDASIACHLVASHLRAKRTSLPHDLTPSTPTSIVKNQKQSFIGSIHPHFPKMRKFLALRREQRTRRVAIVTLLSGSGRGERLRLSFPSQASFLFCRDLLGPTGCQIPSLQLLNCLERRVPSSGSAVDGNQEQCGFDVRRMFGQIFQKVLFGLEVGSLEVGRLGEE